MTRRGSIVYYLAAWACGSFFTAVAIWVKIRPGLAHWDTRLGGLLGLAVISFYGLITGAVPSWLFAFLLRRIANFGKWHQIGKWVIGGAVLLPIFLAPLGAWGSRIDVTPLATESKFFDLFLLGPEMVFKAGLWLAVPVGGLTAFVLGCVERAFQTPAESR